jgi:hypothetical protein
MVFGEIMMINNPGGGGERDESRSGRLLVRHYYFRMTIGDIMIGERWLMKSCEMAIHCARLCRMAVACGTFQARGGPADDESSVCFGLLQL